MICCKMYLALSALIACHVSANHESLKIFSQLFDVSQVPWNSRYNESAPSKVLPRYHDFYKSSRNRSGDHFGSSSKHLPISNFKKEPRQENDMTSQDKPAIPFYPNEDSFKRKEFVPLSANCREVGMKSIAGQPRENVTICYKCKDPKTKSTYEHCLYNGRPRRSVSASTNVKHFLSAPVSHSFRHRRSNLGKETEGDYGDYYRKPRNPYRFTEEYFIGATHDVPAAYENKGEVCDKVVKDSMVCMICKDAKTNGKYEQCSYVKPREKAYSYTKSSSFGKPEKRGDDNVDQPKESRHSEFEASDRTDRNPTVRQETHSPYHYRPSEDHRSNGASSRKEADDEEQDDRAQDDATSANCRKIQKDSKTCVVCKDPKAGTYEKCTYNYQPNEKLHKYSRSKTFGYPDKTDSGLGSDRETAETSGISTDYSRNPDSTHDYLGGLEASTYPQRSGRLGEAKVTSDDSDSVSRDSAEPNERNDEHAEEPSNTEHPISSSNVNSDTESYEVTTPRKSNSENNPTSDVDSNHCKKFQKDSMTCTVCKDPKTGNNLEQCSYSYQPSDKFFSYSKSTSFGNSQRDKSQETSPHRRDEATDNNPDDEAAKKSFRGYVSRQTYEATTADEATSTDNDDADQQDRSKQEVAQGYLNTAKKKAEIEEFLQNFGKEDRSRCRKVTRDKMTCYRCADEDGFQKEECVFMTGQEPDKAPRLALHHEAKRLQVDPAATSARRFSLANPSTDPSEPNMSASGNSYVKMEKPDNEYPEEAPSATQEETTEAEPYDYTSETRPRYDKVLGFTLPAYMFTTSEHEAAFDEVVASDQDQR